MKIVLVDENKETFEVLNEIAKLSGSEIIYFDDVSKAKEFLKENTAIDGIILEKYIKKAPSGELIVYLKSMNINIPAILLTEDISDEEKEYFSNLGITEIIEKPFNPLEVMTAIVEYLKEQKGEEYIKETLQSDEVDKNALKIMLQKIINILKKLFRK